MSFASQLLLIFRSLGAVLGAGLLSVGYACGIQRTSDDVVSGTRKILNTAAADQNYGVLLKFGFLGVAVLTAVQTPLFCGADTLMAFF